MLERLNWLRQNFNMPKEHENYLKNQNLNPKIIYDIGSCTLHWYDMAKRLWPNAEIYVFDAMQGADEYYKSLNLNYYAGLLSDKDHDVKSFWSNRDHPAGNSCYRENVQYSPQVDKLYSLNHRSFKLTRTLDSLINEYNWPFPNLIKMDVQGSELDILKGSKQALSYCENIILEVQNLEYNLGAPFQEEITEFLSKQKFKLINSRFSGDHVQGDAHYQKN